MKKLATVVGARPQFVKAAVLSRVLAEGFPDVREVLIHTGQHFDANMSDVFFDELDIRRPDHHLGIGGGTHGANTGRMLEQIERVLLTERPDAVLVYGDTDSTLAGAVAAVKLHIPAVHVEAGLRSFNRAMPEEINRVLTDHVCDWLFTPTDTATKNLDSEGIRGDHVRQCGDIMFDAALHYAGRAEQRSRILTFTGVDAGGYVLATVHRPHNTDDPVRLSHIVRGLAACGLPVVWPLHPRTRNRLREFGLQLPPQVRAIDPVGYLDMVQLERRAKIVVTDSGGVQKEAFFHGVPCLTLREETEWVELVESGWNRLVPPASAESIAHAIVEATTIPRMSVRPYGEGRAGHAIAAVLVEL